MSLFCGMNMFMNNGLNWNFSPFSNYSFNNFSFFNFPSFNFGNFGSFDNFGNFGCFGCFGNFGNFGNFWGAGNFNNNNISIFNNFSMPAFDNCWNNFSYGDTFTRSSSTTKSKSTSGSGSGTGMSVLNKAMSYVGNVNSDAEGVRLFSPAGSPSSRGWCCDFATYCASKALGSKYPKSMITGGPAVLKSKAIENGCWVNGWSSSAKPGDIILLPGKGVSGLHIAIIKSIDGDGKITAVSGNSSNKVKLSHYSTSSVKGFVSIDKLA